MTMVGEAGAGATGAFTANVHVVAPCCTVWLFVAASTVIRIVPSSSVVSGSAI
jgi:hypothetical protein